MALTSRWQKVAEQGELIGIIQDEQPALVLLQPALA